MQQVTVQQAMQYVGQLLETGRYNEAEPILQQILQQIPQHAEAVHCMAFISNSRRDSVAAEKYLRRAIELDPNMAVYHQNLGVLLASIGKQDPAAESFRRAIQLDPNYADAIMKLGMVYEEKGQLDEAMNHYRRSLAIKPNYAEAYCTMGDVFCKQEKLNDAMACYDQALRINPNLAEAYANRGTALNQMGRTDEAIATTLRAIQINPNLFQALRAMGMYSANQGNFDQSIAYFRRALEVDPNSALAQSGLAITYLKIGRLEEAIQHCRKTIELDPNLIDPYVNLGLALNDNGQHDEALAIYAQGLKVDPNCTGLRANRALVHLVRANFEQGFEDYDFRMDLPEFKGAGRDFKAPRWDGSDLTGKTIIIWHEQGFGDSINFIRYAKLLAARGAKVIVESQPQTVALFSNVEGVQQVITREMPPPPADFHAPMLSLPGMMKTTAQKIPAEIPYIRADAALAEQWRQRVAAFPGFRVGLVWHGNPHLRLDYARSVKLMQFAPLAAIRNVRLFSLQMGAGSEELLTAPAKMNMVDLTREIRDFSDTAALVQNLDLVIAIDTAVVHLAGAMGKPVWVLLQKWPDWRWQLDREDSPWYPTARLFRQTIRGQWQDVFQRVESELQKFAAR